MHACTRLVTTRGWAEVYSALPWPGTRKTRCHHDCGCCAKMPGRRAIKRAPLKTQITGFTAASLTSLGAGSRRLPELCEATGAARDPPLVVMYNQGHLPHRSRTLTAFITRSRLKVARSGTGSSGPLPSVRCLCCFGMFAYLSACHWNVHIKLSSQPLISLQAVLWVLTSTVCDCIQMHDQLPGSW